VLLAIRADQERRHVHDLLANTDVALADEHTRMVDRLGEAELEHESLQAALQELFRAEGKHVIELVLGFIQETVGAHAAQDGFTFEDTLRVLLIERQKNTRRVAELVQRKLHAPELALVAKAELANDLEFGVETFLLERTSRLLEGLTVCVW